MLLKQNTITTFQAQTQKLAGTMNLITYCTGQIKGRLAHCENVYGRDAKGNINGTPADDKYIKRFSAIRRRLKIYYNNQLSKLQSFTI